MCAVSFECISPELSSKEKQVLRSEKELGANERIKRTLKVAYKLFEFQPAPNFGGPEWPRAQRVLKRRHFLMHPKTPTDLYFSDEFWGELRDDVTWHIERQFSFVAALHAKHGG